jgi:hypothetical protein
MADRTGPHRTHMIVAVSQRRRSSGNRDSARTIGVCDIGYHRVIAFATRLVDDAAMKKRAFVALLWFYVGWYGGAMLAEFLGVSALLGPMVGAAAAALFVGDARGITWPGRVTDRARAKQRLT